MTPTLVGRWQTRLFLQLFVGGPLTAFWTLLFGGPKLALLLAYVTALGLALDALYIALQSLRWDRDWPLAFQLAGGCAEGALLFALFRAHALPGAPWGPGDTARFVAHYGSVFAVSSCVLFGPMRVLFPRWRFRGGRVV